MTDQLRKIAAPNFQIAIQRSSVVERSAVNRLVVGSNPTAGALQNYHTAEPTRTKQERPEFGMAVFHKRVNQNIRLESSRILNCSLSANYSFPWAIGPVLAEPNPLKEA